MQELAKEEQLLINCARVKMSPDLARQTEELCSSDLNWTRILSLSDRHGITPLLYHSLRSLGLNGHVEPDVMNYLREAYYANAVRNLKLYEQLKEILIAFNEAGIQTIVLKGAALAETVYGNIALRTIGDIDLMVRKKDLERAHSAMKQLGYSNGSRRLTEWYENNHHHLAPYTHPEKIVPVEIHHHLFPPHHNIGMAIERFWKETRSVEISHLKTAIFTPEDLLLHICFHAAMKGAKSIRLNQLCDLFEIKQKYEHAINWDVIILNSTNHIISKNLYTMLYLVRTLFGTDKIPDEVFKRLKSSCSKSHQRWLEVKSKDQVFDSTYTPLDQFFWLQSNTDRIKKVFRTAWKQFRRNELVFSPINTMHYGGGRTYRRICSGVLIHAKGLASMFHECRNRSIAVRSWATEPKLPRRIARRERMLNQASIWLSQDAPVGVG